jgi:hypothetical protein
MLFSPRVAAEVLTPGGREPAHQPLPYTRIYDH